MTFKYATATTHLRNAIFLSILCISHFASGQTIDKNVDNITTLLNTVTTSKIEFTQKIEKIGESVVRLTIAETSLKKGNSKEYVYEFNPADIDRNTVRSSTNRDIIQVQLLACKKQDLIRETVDGESISYDNEILVYAVDADNGRALASAFKDMIPIAIKLTEDRLDVSGYGDHITWLTTNVTDANLIKKQYAQKLQTIDKYPGRVSLTVTENSSKSSSSATYEFNLSTLNPNSVVFDISGEEFSVEMETRRKLKTIKYYDEGVQKNYVNRMCIVFEDIEMARDLQKVLKDAIPLADTALTNFIQKVTSVSQGVDYMNGVIKNINVNDVAIEQGVKGDCVASFSQKETDGRGSSDILYTLNWRDFNANSIRYDTKGQFIQVSVETKANNRYIKKIQNGEQKNYISEYDIFVPEIEDAIALQQALKSIIKLCEDDSYGFEKLSQSEVTEKLRLALQKVDINDKSYEQKIEIADDNNAVSFTNTEIDNKSSEEQISEFNLSNINPSSVKLKTSGKNVLVTFSTYYLEKIIKYYEDGDIKNYKNTLEFQATDIENGRMLKALLENSTGNDK